MNTIAWNFIQFLIALTGLAVIGYGLLVFASARACRVPNPTLAQAFSVAGMSAAVFVVGELLTLWFLPWWNSLIALLVTALTQWGLTRWLLRAEPQTAWATTGLSIVLAAIFGMGSFVVIGTAVLDVLTIEDASMSPDLVPGERVLIGKRLYAAWGGEYLPKSIVVFRVPTSPPERPIFRAARVIGLPGETVALSGRDIFVSRTVKYEGAEFPPPPSQDWGQDPATRLKYAYPNAAPALAAFQAGAFQFLGKHPSEVPALQTYFVQPGTLFLLVDDGEDSRTFGCVASNTVAGRVFAVATPFERVRVIP